MMLVRYDVTGKGSPDARSCHLLVPLLTIYFSPTAGLAHRGKWRDGLQRGKPMATLPAGPHLEAILMSSSQLG